MMGSKITFEALKSKIVSEMKDDARVLPLL